VNVQMFFDIPGQMFFEKMYQEAGNYSVFCQFVSHSWITHHRPDETCNCELMWPHDRNAISRNVSGNPQGFTKYSFISGYCIRNI